MNLTARGDTTALQPRVKPLYHEMLDLKLIDSIEDYVEFDNFFRNSLGLNAHEAYGYLAQPLLAEVVGDWLERTVPSTRRERVAADRSVEVLSSACESPSRDTPEDHPWGSCAHIPVRTRSREGLSQSKLGT